jgi:hypothetical protein
VPPALRGPSYAPDAFAPGGAPYSPPLPATRAFASPSYTLTGLAGAQLFYSSSAVQASVYQDLGTTLLVTSVTGFPARYPYTLLLDWGLDSQEVVTVTTAPTGNGPYRFSNVMRGQDGTPQVTHAPGAPVNHGVSARDFFQPQTVFNVCAYGADPTGTVDSSQAIQAAVSAAIAEGGKIVRIPAGNYLVNAPVMAVLPVNCTLGIQGDGYLATILYPQFSGDCIRMYSPVPYVVTPGSTGMFTSQRSGIGNLTIDGTFAGPGSSGLHAGDIQGLMLDLNIRNFTGAGSIGLHIDNSVNWTEQADIRVQVNNCTSNVVFDTTGGTDSFGYGKYDFSIVALANQDGLVLKNGAQIYHSNLTVRGDFSGGPSAVSNAVLRVTGACPPGTPNAGQSSAIFGNHVQIQVENTIAGAFNPQTIFIDTGCYINQNYGILDFTGGGNTFVPSNITVATNPNPFQFAAFLGPINGDLNLNPAGGPVFAGPVSYTLASAPVFTGTSFAPTLDGDIFAVTLTGNTTMAVGYSGSAASGPQRKTFYITQAASGGPYTVTWPVNGSPTPASPNIAWPGGVTPVMSPAAGAVDVYMLETYDGAHWFGHVIQAQGSLEPFTQVLGTAFTSGAGTTAQTVTGMAVTLPVGKYSLAAWVPMTPAGVTGSTQTLAWTFGGTASSAAASWKITGPAGITSAVGTALTTSSGASPTMTATGLIGEFAGHAVVTAAGTLQLTVKSTTSGDECTIPAGAWITVTPAAS